MLEARSTQYLRAIAPGAGLFAGLLAVAFGMRTATPFFLVGPVLVLSTLLAVWLAGRKRRPTLEGVMRFDPGGLRIGNELIAARNALQSGVLLPSEPEGNVLRLSGHGMSVDIVVATPELARQALVELALDARHSAATFRAVGLTGEQIRQRTRWMIVTIALLFPAFILGILTRVPAMIPAFFIPVVFTVLSIALSMSIPGPVVVGADGVSVRGPFRRRFISLDGVKDAFAIEDAGLSSRMMLVRFVGDGGGIVDELVVANLKKNGFETVSARYRSTAEALAERVREAIAARAEAGTTFDPHALARQGRHPATWLRALVALRDGAETFRAVPPPPRASLLEAVEDPRLPASIRAAAAVAAVAPGDDEARVRVRIAAEAAASPELRAVLEAAASDASDEASLAEALAALDEHRA